MSKQVRQLISDDVVANVASLDVFWRRTPFHDMEISSIRAIAGRVIISVGRYVLILTGVTRYDPRLKETPTSWLYETIESSNGSRVLNVEAEAGKFSIVFRNLRLLRDEDYAVLIPQLDN